MFDSSVSSPLSPATFIQLKSAAKTFQGVLGRQKNEQLYTFKLGGRSRFDLVLKDLRSNADIQLGQDRNQNGQVDASEILANSSRPGKLRERISTELSRGTYFLRVFPPVATDQTRYTLKLSADRLDEGTFRARYYNTGDLSGAPTFLERLGDNRVGFSRNWSASTSNSSFSSPAFSSAQFTTLRKLDAGLYQIQVNTADAVRVKVGGQTVLEQWTNPSANRYSGYFYSTGKAQRITVDYAKSNADGAIDFSLAPVKPFEESVDSSRQWKATLFNWDDSQSTQPNLDFFADDLNNPNAIGVINLGSTLRPDGRNGIYFDWGWGAVNSDDRLPSDRVAIRATTRTEFDGGTYNFRVRGDDGFQLVAKRRSSGKEYFITPANTWTQAYGSPKQISYTLPKGSYDLTFLYYEGKEVADLDLSWQKDPTSSTPSTDDPVVSFPPSPGSTPSPSTPFPPTKPLPPAGNSGGSSSGGSSSGGSSFWDQPLYGYTITDRFGNRSYWNGSQQVSSFHKGIDFGTGDETPPVEAAAKGTVTYAQTGWNGGFGNLVEIDHGNGLLTRYAHLSKIAVQEGDQVDTSSIIGNVGSTGNSTGNHLHFEIVVNGDQKNPEDYISFV